MYRGAIPAEAAADSRQDSGTGSRLSARLFKINKWMWRYGRTFPLDVTASVADAVAMRKQRIEESRALGAATLQHRREQAPGPQ